MVKKFKAHLAQKALSDSRRKRYTAIRIVERVGDVPENTRDLVDIVQRDCVQQWRLWIAHAAAGTRSP
jgi:hypothetical protein